MKSQFRHVALFGRTHASLTGAALESSRKVLDEVGHFLARQGCEVVLDQNTAQLTGLHGYTTLNLDEIGKQCDLGLVVGGDGVGTKLKLAFEWNMHDTVGIDLVAMSVNDVLVQGAEPLFFLDYFACGKLDVDTAAAVVGGIAKGCELSGCALIGGETAEMPGMYPAGEYDLAGFAVGAVEKSKILTGQNVQAGDVVLGLASAGVHSNGFSLVRKCIERAGADTPATLDGQPFKQAIMEPTRLYVKNVLAALAAHPNTEDASGIKALAHITGGGLLENIPRVLPDGLAAHLQKGSWPQTELFAWLQKTAGIDDIEMNRTFNNGIGMVVVIAADQADACAATLRAAGETVYTIGKIAPQDGGAQVVVA